MVPESGTRKCAAPSKNAVFSEMREAQRDDLPSYRCTSVFAIFRIRQRTNLACCRELMVCVETVVLFHVKQN
jgi:hypothetical protein